MAQDVSVGIGADNSQLLRSLEESKSAMKEFFETITEEAGGVGQSLESVNEKFASAFEFTGLAFATEAIHKIGETIEELGSKALEIKTVSSVIGVTTDQFQAMQAAAEEAGVGSETLVRASERLISALTEARNGSGAAIEKLLSLGVSIEQVNDPGFKLIGLLKVLKEQLEDSSTHQEIMNQLMLVLGNRATLAAAAIQEFDGTEAGVGATMDRINGLTETQIDRLGKAKVSWSEYFTSIWNGMTKVFIGSQAMDMSGMNALTMGNAGSAQQAQKSSDAQNPFKDLSEQAREAAEGAASELKKASEDSARQQENLNREIQLQELDNMKAGIAAYQEGSHQKLEALQREYEFAQQVYGSSQVDKVKAIYQQIIAEQKSVFDSEVHGSEMARAAEDAHVAGVLRGYASQIEASGQYLQAQEQDAARAQQMARQRMQLDDQAAALRLKQISLALGESERFLSVQQRDAQMFQQRWGGAFRSFENAFNSAISGMLRGGESFGEAMRGVFASIAESALQNAVKNIATMAMQSLVGDSIRSAEIKKDAGAAAAGAYKAIAGIPYVGPFLAPAAAAVAYAGVLAFESAEGGYDIPGGINPVTQLHQREMVLPAPIADTVRDAMSNKGRTTVHIHGGPKSTFSQDQLAGMLKSLGHRFKLV